MAVIKRSTNSSAGEGMEKRDTPTLLLGMQGGAATVENSMELPLKKKAKIQLLYDPKIPLLGICPDKTTVQKDTCMPLCS